MCVHPGAAGSTQGAGAGTLTVIQAALTEDLHAQLCKSVEQTWELWRTDAGF